MKTVEAELAALRTGPPAVDVVGPVMARIEVLPSPSTARAIRPWRSAAMAAGIAGSVSAAGLAASWPAARASLAGAVVEILVLSRTVADSSAIVAVISRTLVRALESAGSTAVTVAGAVQPLRPVADAASATIAALTAAVVAIIVLRDFSRARVLEER